jgi:hypothetical protein
MSKCVRRTVMMAALLAFATFGVSQTRAQSIVPELEQEIRQRAAQIEEKVIAWRRDIHEHPELVPRHSDFDSFDVSG